MPATRTGHVRPAPRVRAPPRGRSVPVPGHLAPTVARGCDPAFPAFPPLRLSPAPASALPPRAFPAASPGPPVCLSSLAGGGRTLGGSGRGTGECHPKTGPKPFACPKGPGSPVGPRGAGGEGGVSPSPFQSAVSPPFALFFLTLSYPRRR